MLRLITLALLALPAANAWSFSSVRPLATTTLRVPKHASPLKPSLRLSAASMGSDGAQQPPEVKTFGSTKLGKMIPPKEMKKLLPLAAMFFCVLFNYTILRNTKDVLVVTAPGAGAEVIPFLKTYVQLPGAIIFTIIYSKLCNMMTADQVFYATLAPFVGFYSLFAFLLYPLRNTIHPHAFMANLAQGLPALAAPISLVRNWSFSAFYLMAELWGSVVLSVLFWGQANAVMNVQEAKKYYPLFGIGANVALLVAGQIMKFASQFGSSMAASTGVDAYALTLKILTGAVLGSSALMVACHKYIQSKVMTDPECVDVNQQRKSKTKSKMTLKQSAAYLAKSPYMRDLATLVVAYGMSINIVEVTWKGRLRQAFPEATAYSAFMGTFSSWTGAVTIAMMLLGRKIFDKFGWGVAALITPSVLLATGVGFFSLILAPGLWTPVATALSTTPLMLAVLLGAVQNIMSKSSKYSLFDPCKEMAYIPLSQEERTKGKAAVDVIGNPLGKSGGSMIQQVLLLSLGSLAAATPYLAGILFVVIAAWIRSAKSLSGQFEEAMAAEEKSAAAAATTSS